MDLYFSTKGVAKVSMIEYLKKIIVNFPEEVKGTSDSPYNENLFKVRDLREEKQLPEEQVSKFHHTMPQLLFLAMRARTNIQTMVSILMKQAQAPNKDDWGKLKKVIKYLKGTMYMKLTLVVNNIHTLRWRVDTLYGVHSDLKGHTGMMMSLGKGAAMSFSWGQK